MSDLDYAHQALLTQFARQIWSFNPAGIGNECTHWIYAALLEARALTSSRSLHIQQLHNPYTWGRRIPQSEMIAGDILQFSQFHNTFYFSFNRGDRWEGSRYDLPRGRHTAMCIDRQCRTRDGDIEVLESHLHHPNYPVMTVRSNRIYTVSFSVAMTRRQFEAAHNDGTFPADLQWFDMQAPATRHALATRPNWLRIRDRFRFDDAVAAAAWQEMRHRPIPRHLPSDLAFVCRLHTTGRIHAFRPQASAARLAMDAAAFAAEKQRLIAMLIRTGRPGEQETRHHHLDQYDSDNKRARRRDHYFDWRFTPRAA